MSLDSFRSKPNIIFHCQLRCSGTKRPRIFSFQSIVNCKIRQQSGVAAREIIARGVRETTIIRDESMESAFHAGSIKLEISDLRYRVLRFIASANNETSRKRVAVGPENDACHVSPRRSAQKSPRFREGGTKDRDRVETNFIRLGENRGKASRRLECVRHPAQTHTGHSGTRVPLAVSSITNFRFGDPVSFFQ